MKNALIVTVLVIAMLPGCKKDTTDPTPASTNSIAADKLRLTVTMPMGIKDGDVFTLAGNFPAEAWNPKKSTKYELTKTATANVYSADISLSALPTKEDWQYKVVRNATAAGNDDGWYYVEKDATCYELTTNHIIAISGAGGKEFKLKVDNFRNTAPCHD